MNQEGQPAAAIRVTCSACLTALCLVGPVGCGICFCLPAYSTPADCPEGMACAGGACFPEEDVCQTDEDCRADQTCVEGRCR